jgi:hypothetical protein
MKLDVLELLQTNQEEVENSIIRRQIIIKLFSP